MTETPNHLHLPNGGVHQIPASTPGVLMGDPAAGDPGPAEALGDGMRPLPEGTDVKVIAAVMDLLHRTRHTDFEIAFDDAQPAETAWAAHCVDRDNVDVIARGWSSPEVAAERLARRALNGGRCASCGRPMSVHIPLGTSINRFKDRFCLWERDGTRFERGCRDTHEEFQATREAMAQEGLDVDL